MQRVGGSVAQNDRLIMTFERPWHSNIHRFYRCLLVVALMGLLSSCVSTTRNDTPKSAAVKPEPLYTQMTAHDIELANDAVRRALESALSGTTFSWQNPRNGHQGTVTPTRSFRAKEGFFCRTYAESLTIAPRTESYVDTACRASDGQWRPVAEGN